MLATSAIAETRYAKIADAFQRPRRTAEVGATESDAWRIIGTSPELRTVFADLECVAPTNATVLITGETGTGKDLLARRVHERSDRRSGPFVHVDCTTLTAGLMESELYGHARGAFTGASGAYRPRGTRGRRHVVPGRNWRDSSRAAMQVASPHSTPGI